MACKAETTGLNRGTQIRTLGRPRETASAFRPAPPLAFISPSDWLLFMQAPPYSCHVTLWLLWDWLACARGAVGCRPEEAEGRGRGKPVSGWVLRRVVLCSSDCPIQDCGMKSPGWKRIQAPTPASVHPLKGGFRLPKLVGWTLFLFLL